MKKYLRFLLAVTLLGTVAGTAHAASIGDVNIFDTGTHSATIAASSSYDLGTFPLSGVVDRSGDTNTNQFFFADSGPDNLLSISNFSAPSGISTLRFYDTQEYQMSRNADSVTIYTSSTNQSSLTTGNYTLLGTFALPKGANGYYSSGADSTGGNGNYDYFDDLTNLGISSSTQSILLDFGHTNDIGTGVSEIQAFGAVPEPSTYAMLLAGVLGFTFLARRKIVRFQV